MKRTVSLPRALCIAAAALFFLYCCLPFTRGHDHVGVFVSLGVSAVLLAGSIWFPAVCRAWVWIKQRKAVFCVVIALIAVAAVLVVLFLVASGFMIAGCFNAPPEGEAVTVLVPGAGLRGDRPSRMLADRLNTAAAYLDAHPDAFCIVSGGQGDDEVCPEGTVMKGYLIEQGIAPERIYVEDASTSTYENMRYSMEIITREGLPDKLLIATQEFHQFRAGEYARRAGAAEAYALPCASPWYSILSYWVREFAAISRMVLLGY